MTEKFLVIGAGGLLGRAACEHLLGLGASVVAVGRRHLPGKPGCDERALDLHDVAAVHDLIRQTAPHHVIYLAALTDVDGCESQWDEAVFIHRTIAADLARLCADVGARFLYLSTDHLWRGDKPMVSEGDEPEPINAYARSKRDGELAVLAANPAALVVRTNFFDMGHPWRISIADWVVNTLRAGKPLNTFRDVFFTPIATGLLLPPLVSLLRSPLEGVYHVAGNERVSKHDFAVRLAQAAGLPVDLICPKSVDDARFAAPRPKDMSLSCRKFNRDLNLPLPTLGESLDWLLRARMAQH